jgi:hypothetical protein
MDDKALQKELHSKLIATSYALLDTAHLLQFPEALPVPATEHNPVEKSRKTLRWLRNLQGIWQDMEHWMYIGDLPEQQTKAQYLQNLIMLYAGQVKMAQLTDPELLTHFTIDHANCAAGSIALSIALHTLESLPEGSSFISELDSRLDNIPPEWDNRQVQSVDKLIDAIESGLTHLLNKPLGDRSPIDRLVELSNNLQEAVRQLYTIDTLQDPAREESVELAREILRKLKNMSFSDKPIEESIDTGRPDEKLAFAKRISEMVEMYRNMLHEATLTNPEIINDIRVRAATDAANNCAHSVQIMAAKEITQNSTTLHQISADLGEHGGKKFHSASLNKLMSRMEGGVEQAADEISSSKDQKQKASFEAESAMQADRVRRRRRQRHSNNIVSNPNAAKRSNMINQHHLVVSTLKDEDRPPGLNNVDIAAIRQAGNSLRKSNKQANDMVVARNKNVTKNMYGIPMEPATPKTVAPASPVSPDDKGFAARERDPLNPNHPNNPRNNRPRIG